MFLSAFACMNADPASRTYYDKQRARGKTHTSGPPSPRTPTHQRPVRHAPRRHLLRTPHAQRRQARRMTQQARTDGGALTKDIEAPPASEDQLKNRYNSKKHHSYCAGLWARFREARGA